MLKNTMQKNTFPVRTLRRVMIAGEPQPVGAVLDVDGVDVAGMLDSRAVELVRAEDASAVQAAVRAHVIATLRAAARPPATPQHDEQWQSITPRYYS